MFPLDWTVSLFSTKSSAVTERWDHVSITRKITEETDPELSSYFNKKLSRMTALSVFCVLQKHFSKWEMELNASCGVTLTRRVASSFSRRRPWTCASSATSPSIWLLNVTLGFTPLRFSSVQKSINKNASWEVGPRCSLPFGIWCVSSRRYLPSDQGQRKSALSVASFPDSFSLLILLLLSPPPLQCEHDKSGLCKRWR